MPLKNQIVSGLKWSALGKIAAQVVSWFITIYVIRLLDPKDYGLMAMISVVIVFMSLFNEFGLGSAIIQAREIDDESIGAVAGAVALLGIFLSVLLALLSPWIAGFFNEPEIARMLALAGLQFILSAFTVLPESLLRREMQFKKVVIADFGGTLTGSFLVLLLAYTGNGVWSLVIGNLTGALIRTTILNLFERRRIRRNLKLRKARSLLSYSGYMTAAKFVSFFASQADVFIGAKFLGKDALGLYTVALQLASLPMDKTMSAVNQVAFSAIARTQGNKTELRTGLSKAFKALGYIAFPAAFGLACISQEFVALILGAKWAGAVLPLQLVAITIPLRMIGAFQTTAIYGVGRSDIGFQNTISNALILPLCFLVSVHWGAIGLACAWIVGSPFIFFFNLKRSCIALEFSRKATFSAIFHPFISATIMSIVLISIQINLNNFTYTFYLLILKILIGAFIFCITSAFIDAEFRSSAKKLLKSI